MACLLVFAGCNNSGVKNDTTTGTQITVPDKTNSGGEGSGNYVICKNSEEYLADMSSGKSITSFYSAPNEQYPVGDAGIMFERTDKTDDVLKKNLTDYLDILSTDKSLYGDITVNGTTASLISDGTEFSAGYHGVSVVLNESVLTPDNTKEEKLSVIIQNKYSSAMLSLLKITEPVI